MMAKSHSGFAQAYREAVDAVLKAVATIGEERRQHLSDARMAVGKASHNALSGEEWYLADHLRRSIKDVELAVTAG